MKTMTSEKSIKSEIFKIKIGTLNKKNPTTMYVEAGTYITPKDTTTNYKNEIADIDKQLKIKTKKIFENTSIVENDFILVTDVAVSRLSPERGTHYTIQVHFRPEKTTLTSKTAFKDICNDMQLCCDECFSEYVNIISEHGFVCNKTK